MFPKTISYLKFLIKSKNHHGIHSPFVFNFVTKAVYKKLNPENIISIDKYRKHLLKNHTEIKITDYGAGSKIFKSNSRKISQIAKHAGISLKRSKLLYKTVQYFKPTSILEIGTSLGIATSTMAMSAPNAKIVTLEGCDETSKVARKLFEKYAYKNIHLYTGDFKDTLPKVLKDNSYDLIYFDGNHTKKATLEYFKQSLQSIHNNSVLIFDDIHWSQGMEEAWDEIKNHELVKVTIDTFQWGFVFFRKEQEKEHFIIRV